MTEDRELKLMNEELAIYYNIEQKEETRKRLEEMRKKYKKQLPPTLQDRLQTVEARAKSMGFTVTQRR